MSVVNADCLNPQMITCDSQSAHEPLQFQDKFLKVPYIFMFMTYNIEIETNHVSADNPELGQMLQYKDWPWIRVGNELG